MAPSYFKKSRWEIFCCTNGPSAAQLTSPTCFFHFFSDEQGPAMLTADQEKLRAKSLVIESTKHLSHAHTHTPPKPHSYKHSYQAWGHAPGQPALKGYSCSHAESIQPGADLFGTSPPFGFRGAASRERQNFSSHATMIISVSCLERSDGRSYWGK